MIKRTTSIVFVLMANIMLLAHAVVPHHHHHYQVCIEKSHCVNDGDSDYESQGSPSHNHDGENNSNNCILKEPVVVPANSWKIDFKILTNTLEKSSIYDFQNSNLTFGTEQLNTNLLCVASVPTVNFSYFSHISSASGFRAPPVI